MNNLKEIYIREVIPQLKEQLGYKNNLAVPRIEKVTVNVGIGKVVHDPKFLDVVVNTLTRITGQKPVFTKAKKSISNFKVRKGMTVGVMVTLRGNRMYDLIEKLVKISWPRTRDFRGLPLKMISNQGNLNIGFKEHTVFPEIRTDEVEVIHGLEVNITTSAKTKKEGILLFKLLGFPLQEE